MGNKISLDDRAKLAQMLKKWFGVRKFKPEHYENGIDLRKLRGQMCLGEIRKQDNEKESHMLEWSSIRKFEKRQIINDEELTFEKFEPSGNKYPEWVEEIAGLKKEEETKKPKETETEKKQSKHDEDEDDDIENDLPF